MIAAEAREGRYVSFVGIGTGYNSELAEEVTKHPGANYFCITRDEEMQKVVVDDFEYNFFPAGFDVQVTYQSDAFDLLSVYGTPFDTTEEELEPGWHPTTHRLYSTEVQRTIADLLLCTGR